MIEIFIPSDVPSLVDFVGWMIVNMPDFVTTALPNGNPEMAFEALRGGLSELCKNAPKPFCDESFKLADLAKQELQEGNEQASYEALNNLYMNLQTLGADRPDL